MMFNLSTNDGLRQFKFFAAQECTFCGAELREGLIVPSKSIDTNVVETDEVVSRIQNTGTCNQVIPKHLATLFSKQKTLGTVSSHISQLLPIRAALDVLAAKILEAGEDTISIDTFKDPDSVLQGIRLELIELEKKHEQTKRGYRPSAGFPFHIDEDMPQMWRKRERGMLYQKKSVERREQIVSGSWTRFRNTVFGGLTKANETPYGALFELGIANIVGKWGAARIGLTSDGIKLAAMRNPLIHRENFVSISSIQLKKRFSEEEMIWFWEHVASNQKWIEGMAIRSTLKFVEENASHVSDITLHLSNKIDWIKELGDDRTPPQNRAYTSSLVNRWTGLGLLERDAPGTYRASNLGKTLIKKLTYNPAGVRAWQTRNK